MREILFKAKRVDNGEWVKGYLLDDGFENGRMFVGGLVIEEYKGTACDEWDVTGIDFYEVNPDTICQYTGLTDKNGQKIWENDVLKCGDAIAKVSWCDIFASYILDTNQWMYTHFFGEAIKPEDVEVIGNVFDNSEPDEYCRYAYKSGYNKAIDDFVNTCKENIMYKTFGLRECDIYKIAEQLKAGGDMGISKTGCSRSITKADLER